MTASNGVIHRAESVSISNTGTVSTALDCEGLSLVGIVIPAAFTGTAISFQVSVDNSTFNAYYNTTNTVVSMNVTQGRSYGIIPTDFTGWRYLKVVSNAAEGAARTVQLLLRVL